MHKAQSVTIDDVKKIAKLASLNILPEEEKKFAEQFSQIVEVVNELNEINTNGIPETYQVTNLVNITRDDVVDHSRVLSQELALSQAKKTHAGFFVVSRVIDSTDET